MAKGVEDRLLSGTCFFSPYFFCLSLPVCLFVMSFLDGQLVVVARV